MTRFKRQGTKIRRPLLALVLVIALLGLTAVAALAQPPARPVAPPAGPQVNFGLTWDVFAGGGNTMVSTHYKMQSTAGQPVIGPSSSANYSLLSGYWYGIQGYFWKVFLPMMQRD